MDKELRRNRRVDEKPEDSARGGDAFRAAPHRPRPEDDCARSQPAGTAQAGGPQAHHRRPGKEMIRMLSADDKVAEIKRLYYQTSRTTINGDFAKAIDLLKSMPTEEERERVAVYMDGLAQMRSDWARQGKWTAKTKTEKGKT